ncbi:MAG: transporter [Moraxellaceae bacterium]|jgi:PPP family 3-phenylpropionic acid transporter|nr:transporter [Moraxellaceae bacterium]
MPATARHSAVYFWYFALLGGFMPFWSLYLHQELGLSAAAIGQLMAATLLARLLAPPFWGHLADRSGEPLRYVRLGCLMLVLVWAALCIARNFSSLLLILLAYSFFQNAVLAPLETATVHHLGAARERYGLVRRWGSLGFVIAVTGLGLFFETHTLALLPLLLAALALLLFLSALKLPRARLPRQVRQAFPLRAVLARPAVLGFLGASFLLQVSHAPYYTFYSVHLADAGQASSIIGLLWAVAVVAEVLAFTWLHRLPRELPEQALLKAALLLGALRWAVIGLWPQSLPALLAMQLLQGISFAAAHGACLRLLQRHFGDGQLGRGQAAYGMLWGVASALGAWGAGSLWGSAGGTGVFVLATLPCLVAWLWLARLPSAAPAATHSDALTA